MIFHIIFETSPDKWFSVERFIMTNKLFGDLGDWLTAHSSKSFLLLKVKYLFYQMAISNKDVLKLI